MSDVGCERLTLMARGLQSRQWVIAVAPTSAAYGTIGVFVLGVVIDVALLVSSLVLTCGLRRPHHPRMCAGLAWNRAHPKT